jgi:hypothetical protein
LPAAVSGHKQAPWSLWVLCGEIDTLQMNSYQGILLVTALLAFIIPVNGSKKFRLFIIGCVIFELVLGKLSKVIFQNNYVVFNFYSLYCSIFYFYFFYPFAQVRYRRLLETLLVLFIVFVVWNMTFYQGVLQLNNYSYVFGILIVLFAIAGYLKDAVDHSTVRIVFQPEFYLGVGILLFYT